MRITAEMIEKTKDKWWWISAMRRKWPDGMEVTPENLYLVVGMGANLQWWAEDLFRPAALAAYRAATTDAGEKEDKAVEESYVAFHAVTDGPYRVFCDGPHNSGTIETYQRVLREPQKRLLDEIHASTKAYGHAVASEWAKAWSEMHVGVAA